MEHTEVKRIHDQEKRVLTIKECARIIHQRKTFGDIKDDMQSNKEANNGKD